MDLSVYRKTDFTNKVLIHGDEAIIHLFEQTNYHWLVHLARALLANKFPAGTYALRIVQSQDLIWAIVKGLRIKKFHSFLYLLLMIAGIVYLWIADICNNTVSILKRLGTAKAIIYEKP